MSRATWLVILRKLVRGLAKSFTNEHTHACAHFDAKGELEKSALLQYVVRHQFTVVSTQKGMAKAFVIVEKKVPKQKAVHKPTTYIYTVELIIYETQKHLHGVMKAYFNILILKICRI